MIRRYWKLGVVGISCAAIGVGASAIASAGAAGGSAGAAAKHPRVAGLAPRRLLAHAVHGELVLPTGSGFATIALDRGVVQSVNGQQLTLVEGTKKATYRTLTLTIPPNARVRDNGRKATLAEVKSGQRAVVVQGPKRALVVARDAPTR